MKIHIDDELEKNIHQIKVEEKDGWNDDLKSEPPFIDENKIGGQLAPVVASSEVKTEKPVYAGEKELEVLGSNNKFQPVAANKVHGKMVQKPVLSQNLPIKMDTNTELVEKSKENVLPVFEVKEELPAAPRVDILPGAVEEKIEIVSPESLINKSISDPNQEDEHKKVVPVVGGLQIGATVVAKNDISSFRDELLNDIKQGEISPDVKDVVGNAEPIMEKKDESYLVNSTDPKPAINIDDKPKIEATIAAPGAVNDPSVPVSLNPNWNDTSSEQSGPKIEKLSSGQDGRSTAIMIESTVSAEQMKKNKSKKVINIIITIVLLLVIGVAGYVFGWPYLQKFLSTT